MIFSFLNTLIRLELASGDFYVFYLLFDPTPWGLERLSRIGGSNFINPTLFKTIF